MKIIYRWLATINLVLPLVGYVLITSIFLTGEEQSMDDASNAAQGITIPYRLFTIIIAFVVILFAPEKKYVEIPKQIKWLFVFWLMLVLRILYDLTIKSGLSPLVSISRTLLFIPVCILPTVAVLFSHNKVNYKYAYHMVFWGFVVSLILMIVNNPLLLLASDELVQRVAGNVAFSTLQLSSFGASIILMCFYAYKMRYYNRILLLVLVIFATFVVLRAASRGPMVAFVVVICMYVISSFKNPVKALAIFAVISILLFFFSNVILYFIEDVSPILADRLTLDDSNDFTNGRSALYKVGFEKFLSSPLWGDTFAIFPRDPVAHKYMIHPEDMSGNGYIWSHNMVLDAFMGLGIIGGSVFLCVYFSLFKESYRLFKINDPKIWFVMLTLLKVISGFFSGAFYLNDSLTLCIAAVFLISKEKSIIYYGEKSNKSNNHS